MTTIKIDNTLINLCAELSEKAYDKCALQGPRTDTQLLISEFSGMVIVAFRGTQSFKDVKQDMKRMQADTAIGDVHMGFRQCCMEVHGALHSKLGKIDKPIVFTGHSLGGALAQVMSTMTPYDCSCVTFGSPRVGDESFCDYLVHATEGQLVVVEHIMDRVTWVPYFGYSKPKKHVKKVKDWSIFAASAHKMENYRKLAKGIVL